MQNNLRMKSFQCSLTTLSPLFIGCGDIYTPTDYVIDRGVLYHFDPISVPLEPAQHAKLLNAANSNNPADAAAFFASNKALFCAFAHHAVEVGRSVESTYQLMVQSREKRNQNLINRTVSFTRPDGGTVCYVPGSGIKGAIRTSLLNRLSGSQIQQNPFEANLLGGDFSSSPLRFLKVRDFLPCEAVKTRVEECRRYKKILDNDHNLKRLMSNKYEFIMPAQYRLFQGEILLERTIDTKLGIETIKELTKDLHAYYLNRFLKLSKEPIWQTSKIAGTSWISAVQSLLTRLKPAIEAGHAALIRLGGNIGAESLTLSNGSAQILNRKTRQRMESSTSVWTATCGSSFLPFGWAIFEINPDHDNTALKSWCSTFSSDVRTSEALLAASVRQKKVYLDKLAALREQKREQEKAQEEAVRLEKEKQEQLAKLTENMKQISLLAEEMSKAAAINPGTTLYNDICSILSQALQWPIDEQKACAAQLGPLIKKKDMYKGKKAKELKATLAKLRQER